MVGADVMGAMVLVDVDVDVVTFEGTLDVVTTDCESTGTVVVDDGVVEVVDVVGVVVDVVEEVVVACGWTGTVVEGVNVVVGTSVVVTATVVVGARVVVTGAAIVSVAATYWIT